jgi:hypothetical protein
MLAASQDEVKRYINASMKSLQQNKVNGHIIDRFIEKVLQKLSELNPLNYDAQQWSNIKMARIHLNQIKRAAQTEHI